MLAAGAKIERYEVIRQIASGGMGTVYLARFGGAHGFEKKVALKTILPEFAREADFRGMFLDEARICTRLSHPNVAKVLDLGESDGQLFIVFEWVEGCSLGELCRRAEAEGGRLDLGVLLRACADACAGLHAAHELRAEDGPDAGKRLDVVHRDVTPENVLVDGDGFAKVIDFGIAKARDRLAPETRTGLVKGTLQYMAPEQAVGSDVDRRADVWSVGAVLFRGIAGIPPFLHHEALASYIAETAPAPRLPASTHPAVRAIVERAMQRYPGDRFATAEQMRDAIEAVLTTGAAGIGAISRSEIGRKVTAKPAKDGRSEAAPPDPALAATAIQGAASSSRPPREGQGKLSEKAQTMAVAPVTRTKGSRRPLVIAVAALVVALVALTAAFFLPLR